MHVGHQVAQKFNTSTFPPNETGVTVLPWSVATENCGALPPSFADVSRKLKTMIPAKATPKSASRARKLLLIVTGVLIQLNYMRAQDTQFPAQGSQIPGAAQGAAARDAWLADITRWRHEHLIRIGYNDAEYKRSELAWAQRNFIAPQVMVEERYLYDPITGKYTVDRYLDDL